MDKSKNEEAWELLFKKLNILEQVKKNNYFKISASQINNYREARLMTKFDHFSNLPEIFYTNNLTILPITRGDYLIGNFNLYNKVKYKLDTKPKLIDFPKFITTIDISNLSSEAASLNCAYVSGIISDLINEECLPTVSGRMGSGKFSFKVDDIQNNKQLDIYVNNSQIEIDGGFESKNYFCLIEAKNFMVDDFIIRQLYYPFRLWFNKIKKKIIPIFFTYSNNLFTFFIYEFTDVNYYNSIKLIEQKSYSFDDYTISINDVADILEKGRIKIEPEAPFPQADSFERIIDLLAILKKEDLTANEISKKYSFDIRQAYYYTSTLIYLGLLEKYNKNGSVYFSLNSKAKDILKLKAKKRNLAFISVLAEFKLFNVLLKQFVQVGKIPDKETIINIIKNLDDLKVNKNSSTLNRRAQTVRAWFKWINSIIK